MRRSALSLGFAIMLLVGAGVGPAFAAGTRSASAHSEPLASTTCGTQHWEMFYGDSKPITGGQTGIWFTIYYCYNGSTAWSNGTSKWTHDGTAVPANKTGSFGSSPLVFWANVYEGTDWRGAAKWFYPRVNIAASGHMSPVDGGGSYWPYEGWD